jgi:hypothetical protein
MEYDHWTWVLLLGSIDTYTLTVEPTMSFFGMRKYIATCKVEVGHPPGAPLYHDSLFFCCCFR